MKFVVDIEARSTLSSALNSPKLALFDILIGIDKMLWCTDMKAIH